MQCAKLRLFPIKMLERSPSTDMQHNRVKGGAVLILQTIFCLNRSSENIQKLCKIEPKSINPMNIGCGAVKINNQFFDFEMTDTAEQWRVFRKKQVH